MIDVRNLCLTLPGFTLGPLDLQVKTGNFFALMGPTGSGKTLLLESLAGLVRPRNGGIWIGGREVTRASPEERRIGLVYQDHALFPHMTVWDNITYGQRYLDLAGPADYARRLLDMLGLTPLKDRKPQNLSGGEKQRTALARALACRPDLVLLDEPLSSLDPQFREGLRRQLKELHQATGATFFMVTHDFVDALTMADSAAVIRQGRIEQAGPIQDIFHRPATPFIAGFVGMRNIFPVTFQSGQCCLAGVQVRLGTDPSPADGPGHVALRPEDVHISVNGDIPAGWQGLSGRVDSLTREGFSWLATVDCGQVSFTARLEHRQALDGTVRPGSPVTVAFDPVIAHCISCLPAER